MKEFAMDVHSAFIASQVYQGHFYWFGTHTVYNTVGEDMDIFFWR